MLVNKISICAALEKLQLEDTEDTNTKITKEVQFIHYALSVILTNTERVQNGPKAFQYLVKDYW